MSEHAPTPWAVSPKRGFTDCNGPEWQIDIGDGVRNYVSAVGTECESVARRIVRCVNAHDGLVAAVEALLEAGHFNSDECTLCEEAFAQGRAALAAAKGE